MGTALVIAFGIGCMTIIVVASLRFARRLDPELAAAEAPKALPKGTRYCARCKYSEERDTEGRGTHLRCSVILDAEHGYGEMCAVANPNFDCIHFAAVEPPMGDKPCALCAFVYRDGFGNRYCKILLDPNTHKGRVCAHVNPYNNCKHHVRGGEGS